MSLTRPFYVQWHCQTMYHCMSIWQLLWPPSMITSIIKNHTPSSGQQITNIQTTKPTDRSSSAEHSQINVASCFQQRQHYFSLNEHSMVRPTKTHRLLPRPAVNSFHQTCQQVDWQELQRKVKRWINYTIVHVRHGVHRHSWYHGIAWRHKSYQIQSLGLSRYFVHRPI